LYITNVDITDHASRLWFDVDLIIFVSVCISSFLAVFISARDDTFVKLS